jgi:RecB family exonuclease
MEAPASLAEVDQAFQRSESLERSLLQKTIFSTTELVDYARCGRCYYFMHILGLPEPFEVREREGISARERGLIIHHIFENYPLPPEANLDDLVIYLAQEEGISASEATLRGLGAEIQSLLEGIADEDIFRQMRRAEVIERELGFTTVLNDFVIRGFMDVAFPGPQDKWTLLDYKTDAIKVSEVEERARHYQTQIDAYSLASRNIFGDETREIVFYFLMPKVAHRTAITPEFLKGAEERLLSLIGKIGQGEFPADTHRCPYCAFENICEEASKGRG